jgi:hypothetical protein
LIIPLSGLSIFFKCTSKLEKKNHEYLKQQSLKLEGTNYHFKWVKIPGTTLPQYNLNIVESGVKHHKTNQPIWYVEKLNKARTKKNR